MRLLIDEDSQAKLLVDLLREDGHDVVTLNELNMTGTPDAAVLEVACTQNRVVLTHNCKDFHKLHELDNSHSGILTIYKNDDPQKDMGYKEIVTSISNIEETEIDLKNKVLSLNQFRW